MRALPLPVVAVVVLAVCPGASPAQRVGARNAVGARPVATRYVAGVARGPAPSVRQRAAWRPDSAARHSTPVLPRRPRRLWLRAAGVGALAVGGAFGVTVASQGRQCGFESNESCAGWGLLAAGIGGVLGGVVGGVADLWRHARWEREVARTGAAP